MIIGLRLAVLVIALGGWEIAARLKWIDPFFYSKPSVIWWGQRPPFIGKDQQGERSRRG